MEFALVVVLLCMLVFGVIDFGVAYNDYQSVRSGTREGARLATVNDIKNAPTCKIDGNTVTPPASPGNAENARNAIICKTKSRIGLDDSDVKVRIIVDGTSVGSTITICASSPVNTGTGLFDPILGGKTLKSSVVMRVEQPPTFDAYSEPGGAC